MFDEIKKCDLCGNDIEQKKDEHGKVYWNMGHNAEPLVAGRCCDACNGLVIMARLKQMGVA